MVASVKDGNKAEELFRRGKYKESLDLSVKSISFIDKNIVEND